VIGKFSALGRAAHHGVGLYDDRPADATGGITLSHTTLSVDVAPRIYEAPYCDTENGTICIVNSGNKVTAH